MPFDFVISLINHLFYLFQLHLELLFIPFSLLTSISIYGSMVLKTEQITNVLNSEQRPSAEFLLGL